MNDLRSGDHSLVHRGRGNSKKEASDRGRIGPFEIAKGKSLV
ncbi:hypothetical protein FRUB_06914 [Fimbriiglobus ruber]|uniref:Uncharacterized protein n=1 Tax=Fimbriiglobus ruber TaxID=1908690 RepID=A0A225DDT4_9BACT|nr:hypothetical protein FRUB_06914 [Fimbriiglobus ruber]